MLNRIAGPDYQALAVGFHVGDVVVPYGANRDYAGRVVSVWPAIGMVDVEFPAGSKRYPVEDLLRLTEDGDPNPPEDGYVPGGAGTVSVPGGPFGNLLTEKSAANVADAFVKKALYWAAVDRQYRATSSEIESGCYICPKCKNGVLKKAIYRRVRGRSEHLFGCPECLFLISREALIHPERGDI